MPETPNVALLLFFSLVLTSCAAEEDPGFAIPTWTTGYGADQSTSFAFRGDRFAYLASEAHSNAIDVNSDGDQSDFFPVAVNTVTKTENLIAVAAHGIVWVGAHLYIEVLESDDGVDWDGSSVLTDRVLLHWTDGMAAPEYVLTLDPSAAIAVVSTGALAVCATTSTATVTETSLVLLEAANPTAPAPVFNDDLAAGTTVEILGLEDGLLFVGIDETSSGVDHNGDMDAVDERVLGLLDMTWDIASAAHILFSIDLALPAGDTPLFAESSGTHDWLVGFLVDEASQDNGTGASLNTIGMVGGSFSPCHPGDVDADISDEVLHFMQFSDVTIGGIPATNSGLVGGERIIHADGYLGTISQEGDEAGCDLNGDGDLADRVFRWVLADRNNLTHEFDDSKLHALGDIGGEGNEIAEMGDRFVIVVNEIQDGQDHDGIDFDDNGNNFDDRDFVAWTEPAAESGWTFHHDSDIEFGWVVATWMGETDGSDRVGIGFSEQSNDVPKDLNNDGDLLDSVPTFAYYNPSSGDMEFPGFAIGGDSDEMGIVILESVGYYRVSEAENGGDLDGNGSGSDYLLVASHLTTGQTVNVSPLNGLSNSAVLADPANASCAAILVDEGGVIGDINGDSDTSGFAVRYIRY